MPLKGRDRLRRRIMAMASPDVQRDIGRALFAGAQAVAVEAQLSITNGAVSGRYHTPSKPGEPPKNDSGVLAGNIEAVSISNEVAEVSSNADPYAAMLEFGTSRMAARPYLRPAIDKQREHVRRLIAKALNRAVRRGGNARG